ncbi:hypothetical protein HZA44_01500, partial [Candidatus Peregrinibacteria bacterium]|nr:hypothetical protein [Candidatus Peregrinibacteria bacterium]
MSDTVLNITDRELLAKLKASHIADAQKGQLEALIPKMSEPEKAELMSLIDRSHEEHEKASKSYNESLDNLGKEFKQKLRKEDKGFRKDLESIERNETRQALEAVQAEAKGIEFQPKPAKNGVNGHKGH